ncbi:hypothetical protein MTO96_024425 [Rhipicephalus appendiculatus]
MLPGPFRAASKPGAFIAMLAFYDIYGKHDLLSKGAGYPDIVVRGLVGGYAVRVQCVLKRESGQDFVNFWLTLCDGEWNHYLEWPFSKKITVIITHLSKREKDIRVTITESGLDETKKPASGRCNVPIIPEWVNWKDIELNGFIVNNTLYANFEFE